MEDAEELKTFIKIWFSAIAALCYCYLIPSQISHGVPRLLSLLPIITVFFLLPLPLSAVHLAGPTVFYLVWLANFKLLLFAFNRGPLASSPPLPFISFMSIALLPINRKQQVNKISDPDPDSDSDSVTVLSRRPILLAFKALILAVIVGAYEYRNHIHRNVILGLYCIHVYIGVELVLAITAFFVRFFLDFQIEPQFNEPYLATSLQDFWGRRWNLMVTSILRPTVYDPVRDFSSPVLGKLWSRLPAIVATFVVSGLMHELIYYYFTRVRPTWEVTCFFVLQGVCTAVEVAVKKVVNGSQGRLNGPVSKANALGLRHKIGLKSKERLKERVQRRRRHTEIAMMKMKRCRNAKGPSGMQRDEASRNRDKLSSTNNDYKPSITGDVACRVLASCNSHRRLLQPLIYRDLALLRFTAFDLQPSIITKLES